MAKKLFVRNLSYDLTDEKLRDAFQEAGEVVSANIVIDRYTKKSRGFGFVEMADEAQADAAIEALNGRELEGRAIVVDKARDKERR